MLQLPKRVESAYKAALQIKNIDPGTAKTLFVHLLELICEDRDASAANLADKLRILAERGEVPHKLADLVGTLALNDADVSVLEAVTTAVLRHVYWAFKLVTRLEKRLVRSQSQSRREAKVTEKDIGKESALPARADSKPSPLRPAARG